MDRFSEDDAQRIIRNDFGVPRGTLEKLSLYADLIKQWSPKINLVGRRELDQLWSRHILDCVQIMSHAPEGWKSWIDLGSGGGLPGIIIALLKNENQRMYAIYQILHIPNGVFQT